MKKILLGCIYLCLGCFAIPVLSQDCSSCDPNNPDMIIYMDPLVTGTNALGNVTAAQFDIYILNNTSDPLNLNTIEYSLAINENLVSSLVAVTSDATFFTNSLVFDVPGGNFVYIFDIYSNPIDIDTFGVNFSAEYEYDHSNVGPAHPPQVIPVGLPTQIMTVYMTFDGTQNFFDDSNPANMSDPQYICNQGFFMGFPGDCVDEQVNINNQFGFEDSGGAPMLMNCYSMFCGSPFNFLPLEITEFNGHVRNSHNELNWTTTTEESIEWHIIERSKDPSKYPFVQIGKVQASGQINTISDYTFTDNQPLRSAYYRIRSLDDQGRNQHSNVIVLDRPGNFEILTVSPNPTQEEVKIEYGLNVESDIRLIIFDGLGRTITKERYQSENGVNSKNIDFSNYPDGMYYIRLENDFESRISKVIKG